MSMKFDAWWEEHWKDCFGIDKDKGICKYPVNGRPKADGVRYALLCYENKHRGSNWDIAIHVNKREIKKAVEELFKVEVIKVTTAVVKGKTKRNRFGVYKKSNYKKAFVSISKDSEIQFEGIN